MGILTKDYMNRDVVSLFETGITIDQKLPKWVNASKRIKEKKAKSQDAGGVEAGASYIEIRQTRINNTTTGNVYETNMDTPFVVYGTPDNYEVDTNRVNFDKVAAANLKELTELIKDGELNNVLSGYGGMHGNSSNNWRVVDSGPVPMDGQSVDRNTSLAKRIKNWTKKVGYYIDGVINKPELDAIKFFTAVKLTSKESAENYRDRVSKYLQAVHNAHMVGQTALVEKLLSEMIANKYESLLYASGKYYVIDEPTLVNFAKKTERGINLCYIKNFARPIPMEVIEKVAEANELEVFDNYVILHYDPKNTAQKETRKEEAKRKDPILFGVIAGSHKLYYITDWIDETCNLTLEKFVDTIGVKKETLLEGGDPNEKEKEEVKKDTKTEEKKKPVKKTTSKKKPSTKK